VPIDTSELTTKSGHKVLRAVFSGDVTVAEAKPYHASTLPGGRFALHGHLAIGTVTNLSADVKKVLGSAQADPGNPIPVAIVVSSALIRMMASLVTRAGANENTEFFKDEASALEWLDSALTKFHLKRKT
jgi:hypothetical protein